MNWISQSHYDTISPRWGYCDVAPLGLSASFPSDEGWPKAGVGLIPLYIEGWPKAGV